MALTICIIEDDEGIQDVLQIILKRAGYETEIFPDGLAILGNNYSIPDLFLIDKQLSGSDGLTICRHLKEKKETKAIPVVLMSAYPNIREFSILAGANDFIEKPFKVETLLATIRKHIEKQTIPIQMST